MLVLVVMGVLNLWLSISSVSILSSLDFSIVLNPYCHGGEGGALGAPTDLDGLLLKKKSLVRLHFID